MIGSMAEAEDAGNVEIDGHQPQRVEHAHRDRSILGRIARKRRTASVGKRVVMVVSAPSRRRRSAMYIPIFARPPVSRARRPVRSVRASRCDQLIRGMPDFDLTEEQIDSLVAYLETLE